MDPSCWAETPHRPKSLSELAGVVVAEVVAEAAGVAALVVGVVAAADPQAHLNAASFAIPRYGQ